MKMFKVHTFKSVGSTLNKAKDFPIGSVIVANEQIKGKGRFKRGWSSLPGGVYLSIVLDKEGAYYLTFVGALCACRAVEDVLGIRTTIKWPNDLLYEGKKVCGILTKVGENAIVGIGINTNNSVPGSLSGKAISLKKIIGKLSDLKNSKGFRSEASKPFRNPKISKSLENSKNFQKEINNKKIINKLLNYFEYYLKLLKDGKYSKVINDWKKSSFLGSKIKVKTLGKTYLGIAYDVDEDCFLILKLKNGKKVRVVEGDVFLK